MKRSYDAPSLTCHGTVEALTQILGPESTEDTLFFNGTPIGSSDDSADVNCTPDGCI